MTGRSGSIRHRRIGLRTTVTLALCAGALLLSLVLALGTYLVARSSLVEQRERTASSQAFADASAVRDGLRSRGVPVSEVLGTVAPPSNTTIVVRIGSRWFSTSLRLGADAVPVELQNAVARGETGLQWTSSGLNPAVAVGINLPEVDAQYYEISEAPDLENTLATLRVVLGSFAILTALGGAALGRAAGRRVLAPLDDIGQAAARIAAGDLTTRLPQTDDPELATIVGSFNTMVAALDQRIARDTRFAADLSHELRSPLTTLITSVDVMHRRRTDLPTRSQQALDLVRVELTRFHRALEDLLELGQLDAGVRVAEFSTVNLSELAREACEATHRSADLVQLVTADSPWVSVGKEQLFRVLWNLLDNADRYADGPRAIEISATGNLAYLTVVDTGPGVPENNQIRIFERFFRSGSRGSRSGTGLGLSLVREIIAAHQGKVWYEDNPDGGARFIVQLPRVIHEEDDQH